MSGTNRGGDLEIHNTTEHGDDSVETRRHRIADAVRVATRTFAIPARVAPSSWCATSTRARRSRGVGAVTVGALCVSLGTSMFTRTAAAQSDPSNPSAAEPAAGETDPNAAATDEAAAQPDNAETSEPALPPGHPPIRRGSTAPGANAAPSNERDAQLPPSFANEAPDLPAGTVLVRVVDGGGAIVPNIQVRLGSMREGESQEAVTIPTRTDGVAQFDRQTTGDAVSYRASVDFGGAHYSSDPFQLPAHGGARVQLVRFDTDADARAMVISDARVEITFRDDRMQVAEHLQIANLSSLTFDNTAPHPRTFVPSEGLRFEIPAGAIAFTAGEDSMGDQHVTQEGDVVVMRGSVPPTGAQNTIPISFQYQLKLHGQSAAIDVSMPLPVISSTIVTEAPNGMHLDVEGMPPAEARTNENQHILITGRERASQNEAPMDALHIRLTNIPSASGPEREIAAVLASAIAFGGIFVSARNRRRDLLGKTPNRKALLAERTRLLEQAAALHRAHDEGDIGPETFERRKRALAFALATVLRDLARVKEPSATKEKSASKPASLRLARR